MNCPLCQITARKDTVFYRDSLITICRTKDLKGHRERIMVIANRHGREPSLEKANHARKHLIQIGRAKFPGTFYLLEDTFSRILDHWHMIASDMNPGTDDYAQMLQTEKIKISR